MKYIYRCTSNTLIEHIDRIEQSGDVVLWPVFKGGRDWDLICRKGEEQGDSVAAAQAGNSATGGNVTTTAGFVAKAGTPIPGVTLQPPGSGMKVYNPGGLTSAEAERIGLARGNRKRGR